MFLGMMTRLHEGISVKDIGIDNKKIADRLTTRIASGFVDKTLESFLSGAYTASNSYLYKLLKESIDIEGKTIYKKCFKTKFESSYIYYMGIRGSKSSREVMAE